MNNPYNQLPADPDWVRAVDEIADAAAQGLDSMVLLVAIQQGRKVCLAMTGVPDAGPLAEIAKMGQPAILRFLADVCEKCDEFDSAGAPQ